MITDDEILKLITNVCTECKGQTMCSTHCRLYDRDIESCMFDNQPDIVSPEHVMEILKIVIGGEDHED